MQRGLRVKNIIRALGRRVIPVRNRPVSKYIPAQLRPSWHLERLTRARSGGRVQAGPFAGMRYVNRSVGSAFIPKILGIYERELSVCVEQACDLELPLIVDIGAAEGYYAVGLARRNPGARVVAFEMQESGRDALREMAALNDVACVDRTAPAQTNDRHTTGVAMLELHGECRLDSLQLAMANAERSLVVCDVEGHEDDLLMPLQIPALAHAFLLVETHDFYRPGVSERLTNRFSPTHEIRRIWQEARTNDDFPFVSIATRLLPSATLDSAVSEGRPERMSWLWMEPRAR